MNTNNATDKSLRFGKLQLRIMRLLWQRPLNAREVSDLLNEQSEEMPTSHSTVQTLLRKLEDKGAVEHKVLDRTFVYYPLVQEQNAIKRATEDFLGRIFAGSITNMISHLLKEEEVSHADLESLRELIREKRGNK